MIISAMNKKNYIIILVFSLLSLSIIVFFIWPYFIEIRARSEELVLEKDQVSSLNIKINELDNFEKEYDNYLPNLQKIEQMFVDPQDPIDFIEFIEDVASDSKIILQVSPQFSSQSKSKNIIFQLSGRGNFYDLSVFLERLEHSPYLVNIESLNVSSRKDGGVLTEVTVRDLSGEIKADLLIEALSE